MDFPWISHGFPSVPLDEIPEAALSKLGAASADGHSSDLLLGCSDVSPREETNVLYITLLCI